MQAGVEKSEEAEHAPEADEFGKFEDFAEWRDAKSEDEEAKGPIAGGVLDEFDWIRAEICRERTTDENAERNKAKKKNGNLGPFVGEERGHAANPAQ